MKNVPDWAADAIWYQIFPERFRNGCPASNPERRDFSQRRIPGWRVMDWGGDWYRQAGWEQEKGAFFDSVYERRYGGDLVGVYERLDYLQDLGVTALYLNPVFQAQSLHKYDASCYHHIDPSFGPDRAGDLKKLATARETENPASWIWTEADLYFVALVKEVHRRSMRIIIDGVFNHTGRAFFAFRDLRKYGKKSRYRNWYKITRWRSETRFDYKGWFGFNDLPELARTRDNLKAPIAAYIADCTRRWMDPHEDGDLSFGVDGWRLDVAACLPHGFWKSWRKVVKGINPDAYLCGEIVDDASAWLQGDELDAVMNYPWAYPVTSFFIRGPHEIDSASCRSQLEALAQSYPNEVLFGLQNLYDSHDTSRILTMIVNPQGNKKHWNDYFNAFRVQAHPELNTRRPGEAAQRVLRQMVVFQMCSLGAPMIYYGTEVGMWGANDPDDRQPMLWDDVEYEQAEVALDGSNLPVERMPDTELFRFYQRAIQFRRQYAELRRGTLRWLPVMNPDVLGFERGYEGEHMVALFNRGLAPVAYDGGDLAGIDVWSGLPVEFGVIDVPAQGWRLVKTAGCIC